MIKKHKHDLLSRPRSKPDRLLSKFITLNSLVLKTWPFIMTNISKPCTTFVSSSITEKVDYYLEQFTQSNLHKLQFSASIFSVFSTFPSSTRKATLHYIMQEFRSQLAGCYLSPFGIISCSIHQLLWSDICLRCSHICSVFAEKSFVWRCSTSSGASRCWCSFLYGDNASRLSLQTSSCLIYFSYSSWYIAQDIWNIVK
jgi:hypothetical protein